MGFSGDKFGSGSTHGRAKLAVLATCTALAVAGCGQAVDTSQDTARKPAAGAQPQSGSSAPGSAPTSDTVGHSTSNSADQDSRPRLSNADTAQSGTKSAAKQKTTPRPGEQNQPGQRKFATKTQAAPTQQEQREGSGRAPKSRRPMSTEVGRWQAMLAALPVRVRATGDGYDRKLFGWRALDFDRNGCDQRNDVLRRDLHDTSIKPGTNGCKVLAGTLHDPYDNKTVRPAIVDIEIDHVVALYDGYLKGAKTWDQQKRQKFANDPLNLLATQRYLNRAKGASDASKWLPPHAGFQCAYVGRQIEVKTKYNLWVTAPERDAMARVLAACSGDTGQRKVAAPAPRPDRTQPPAPKPVPVVTPTSTTTPQPFIPQTKTTPPSAPVYYKNCSAVRAAGKAPIRRGEPGYRRGLDRDNDGLACE